MKLVTLTALVLVLSIAGNAALAQRVAPVKGPPTISCGSYAETRINEGTVGPISIQFFAWIQGYLSAYNNYAKYPMVDVPEYAAIGSYLDKYCQDNPMHHVSNGIDSLIAGLGGYKQPYFSK
jgi:hypothetical protein